MITGRIEEMRQYRVPAEGVEEALEWLEKAGIEKLEPGRYLCGFLSDRHDGHAE